MLSESDQKYLDDFVKLCEMKRKLIWGKINSVDNKKEDRCFIYNRATRIIDLLERLKEYHIDIKLSQFNMIKDERDFTIISICDVKNIFKGIYDCLSEIEELKNELFCLSEIEEWQKENNIVDLLDYCNNFKGE